MIAHSEKDVLRLNFNPPEILERNAHIKLALGDETILVDPEEVCFAHRIPHTLFTPRAFTMSLEGLSGYLSKR